MSDNSAIEWTEATWNPVTGCTKVSPGCDHCYAERISERFHGKGSFAVVARSEGKLYAPLRWRRPRRIFVNSMSDLFHADVPDSFIARAFSVMAQTPQHTYQLLTKRHGRMRSLLSRPSFRDNLLGLVPGAVWPLPNLWLGVSVEDQKRADLRIPALLETPAAVRWLSMEPLLGPVELAADWLRPIPGCRYADPGDGLCAHPLAVTPECHRFADCPPNPATYGGIDWVVVGGESGPGARPMHPAWVRCLRDQCNSVGVPFFFKQWGEWATAPSSYGPDVPAHARAATQLLFAGSTDVDGQIMLRRGKKAAGRELDGRAWDEYPTGAAVPA